MLAQSSSPAACTHHMNTNGSASDIFHKRLSMFDTFERGPSNGHDPWALVKLGAHSQDSNAPVTAP